MAILDPQTPSEGILTDPEPQDLDETTANDTSNTDDNTIRPIHSHLTPAKLQLLARQRPAIFPTLPVELGFVFTIVISMMMSEYFISGFNIVLPSIATSLSIPSSARTWPAAVINLSTAALLLPFARLCDRLGGRVVFLGGHGWLLVWSLACGFVKDANVLIVCRAMQGVGAAAFLPAGLALLGQTYRPGPRKNLVFGVYGAFAVIGFYFGIIIGALAAEYLSWKWYFWIGTVLVLVVIVLGLLTIPRHLDDKDAAVKMDWWGVCTIVPALTLIVFAFTDGGHAPNGWRTPYVYVTLIIGVLLACAAVYVEGWVSKQPLLPADLFRPKYMKRLVAALFCSYGVFGIFLFYASFYLETVIKTGPLLTAAWFTPLAAGGLFLAIGGGFALHLLSGRMLMIISGLGYILCVLLFAIMPAQHTSSSSADGSTTTTPSNTFLYWAYVFPAMLCGTIGVDITFNVTNIFITTAMPRRLQAAAGGLINSLLYFGISFWLGIAELAVSATMEAGGGKGQGGGNGGGEGGGESLSPLQQYRIGFWTGVGLAGVSLCCTVSIKLGQASADTTADEKAVLAQEEGS